MPGLFWMPRCRSLRSESSRKRRLPSRRCALPASTLALPSPVPSPVGRYPWWKILDRLFVGLRFAVRRFAEDYYWFRGRCSVRRSRVSSPAGSYPWAKISDRHFAEFHSVDRRLEADRRIRCLQFAVRRSTAKEGLTHLLPQAFCDLPRSHRSSRL